MKPQTGRIVSLLYAVLMMLLMIDAVCGKAQYASPFSGGTYAIPGVQSIWSGSPIVVNDNQFSAQEQQQQQRQYPNINGYYAAEAPRQTYPNWKREDDTLPLYQPSWRSEPRREDLQPPPRYPNHNYNNVPGYFYYQQQETTPTTPNTKQFQQPYPQHSSRELESSDSRREEEQVVQIGGSRSLATNNYQNVYTNDGNYYQPAQPWRQRDFQAKYAQHFANYLRKYPRRLQPVYDVGEDFDEK
ncbi:uncharacterized protein [Drosophila kikkawai]|uniref:Uncharacterized protein n=1 Tax=Drosophila kikkawai TaxID=30033 RepID=A0A6P4HQS0_DROKI|nr:uncharacterized protein LOC108071865 [Drosophila kikkawai]